MSAPTQRDLLIYRIADADSTPLPPHSSTWTARPSLYLEDLFVLEAYRNKGAGKALFRELSRIAKSTNCGRVDWSVLDWNEPSIAFYKQVLGAKPMDGWTGMRLEEEGIERLQTLGL